MATPGLNRSIMVRDPRCQPRMVCKLRAESDAGACSRERRCDREASI